MDRTKSKWHLVERFLKFQNLPRYLWVLRRHRDRPAFLSGLSSHNWSPFLQWLSCCCWAAQHLGLTVRFFHSLYVLFPRLKNWVCFWSYLEIPVSAWLLLIRFIWKETVLQDKLEKCQAATLGGALHCCRPPGSTGKKMEGIQVSLQGKHLLPQLPVPCMWLCLWTCENLKQPWSTEHSFADSSCIPEAKGNVKRAFAPYARCLSFLPREMSAVSPSTFL